MATMCSLFLGVLLAATCSVKGSRSSFVGSLKPRVAHTFLLDQESTQRNQGLVARLNCLLISGNKTTEGWKPSSAKLNSLRSNKPDCLSEIIDNSLCLAQPRPFYLDNASSTSLQSKLMSPVKLLTLVVGGTTVQSNRVYELSAAKGSSDDFCFFLGKRRSPSGDEDNNKIENNKALLAESRQLIITIASAELGIKEATANNDSTRVDNSLGLTHPRSFYLGSGNSSICIVSKNVAFDIFKNLKEDAQSIVLKISSDEFFASFFAKNDEVLIHSFEIKKSLDKKEEPRHSLVPNFGSLSGIKRNLILISSIDWRQ